MAASLKLDCHVRFYEKKAFCENVLLELSVTFFESFLKELGLLRVFASGWELCLQIGFGSKIELKGFSKRLLTLLTISFLCLMRASF